MDDHVLTAADQLDTERLTGFLLGTDALQSGRVSAVRAEALEATNAHLVALHVEYEPGSTGSLPMRLLLKLSESGSEGFGPSEVRFHVRDYIDLPDPPIPRCYSAAYSDEDGRYHILMEDLSGTHCSNRGVSPDQAYGEAVAEALARLHAHYWDADRRASIGALIPGNAEIENYMAHIKPGVEPMLAASRQDIESGWGNMVRNAVAHHPRLMVERTHQPIGFTVVHGDVNPGNVLSPLQGTKPIYLIDRQPFSWSLTTWLGVSDVAYLMVHWWETDLRRRFEVPVLQTYHRALIAQGVNDYSWDQLVLDYRLSAVQSLYVAAAWCSEPKSCAIMKWVWLPQLRKSMTAFLDLSCSDLW